MPEAYEKAGVSVEAGYEVVKRIKSHVARTNRPGVVGGIAGVIAAQAGAEVTLVSHRELEAVAAKARDFKQRFGVDLAGAVGKSDEDKRGLLADAEVVLACGRAGVEILSAEALAGAKRLKVAADVNAVPPAGIAGIDAHADGKPLANGAVGIGALTIGHLKFRVQHELLKQMRVTSKAMTVGFEDAFFLARSLTA